MKVKLIQESGRTVGWRIEAETTEDKLVLGSIRELEFWGTGDSKPVYDGMESDENDDRYVQAIKYTTRGRQEQRREARREAFRKRNINRD